MRDSSEDRFTVLYRQHALPARNLALLLTSDPAQAEDLAQEAFVRVMGSWARLRNQDAFRSYLMKTVVHLCNSHFRDTKRRGEAATRSLHESRTSTTGPDVETRSSLLQALQKLPVRQRAAVVLRYCEDLSEHQTAEIMGTSTKAVKGLVTRGLAALRDIEEVPR